MRYSTIACVVAVALSSVSWCIETNAFLNRVARNHAELMHQVQRDPVVMDRYKRHYGKSRAEVLAFMRSLRDGRVAETGPFVVYNVPGTGEIRMTVITVRRGTRAWVDASGAAMLKGSCGNPMTRGTDIGTVDLTATVRRTLDEGADLRVVELPETDLVVDEYAQKFALLSPELPAEEAAIGLLPPTDPGVPVVQPPTDPGVQQPPFVIVDEGPIGLIGQAAGLLWSASVVASIDPGVTEVLDVPAPEPIPEPLSITALAIGLGALALRRRKR